MSAVTQIENTTVEPQQEPQEEPLKDKRVWTQSGPYNRKPGVYVVTAEWSRHQGQLPHFSFTGMWFDNWHYARRHLGGMRGDCQAVGYGVIPKNAKLIHALSVFHLCDSTGTPMHYIENGAYLCGLSSLNEDIRSDYIRSHYCWPAVPGSDPIDVLLSYPRIQEEKEMTQEQVQELKKSQSSDWHAFYGASRLIEIQKAMRATLSEAGIAWAD